MAQLVSNLRRPYRLFFYACAVGLCVLLAAYGFGSVRDGDLEPVEGIFGAVLAGLAGYAGMAPRRYRIMLTDDGIVLRRWRTRFIRYDDLTGVFLSPSTVVLQADTIRLRINREWSRRAALVRTIAGRTRTNPSLRVDGTEAMIAAWWDRGAGEAGGAKSE